MQETVDIAGGGGGAASPGGYCAESSLPSWKAMQIYSTDPFSAEDAGQKVAIVRQRTLWLCFRSEQRNDRLPVDPREEEMAMLLRG